MLWLFVGLVISYLVGGFPTGIIAGRMLRGIDIRQHGSGNAGATNVWRVLGPGPGGAVLAVDALKGVIPVLLVSLIAAHGNAVRPESARMICGLMAIVGHVWTPFAGFRGGKGVATAAGVFLALAPIAMLIALVAFVAVVYATRYISAGSITAAIVLPAMMIAQRSVLRGAESWPLAVPRAYVILGVIVGALIVYKHKSNIRRLLNGTENKFGTKPAVTTATVAPGDGR